MRTAPRQTLLDHYEILSILGAGSNGVVYMAQDRSGEPVAIKEFQGGAELAQKFFRELSVVFSVRHPNIVECRNLIYGRGDKNYLVFEFIEGGSLREMLVQRGALEVREALSILKDVCLGLDHAHGKMIVHRDIKPENILIAGSDSKPVYKLADLGIARFQGGGNQQPSSCGSPAYMAPEQFHGEASEASDLYSLGILFFEMLAGKRPFEGPYARLFMMHSQELPDLSLIRHAGCREWIRKLLNKRSQDRPESAADLLEGIECLTDELTGRGVEMTSLPSDTEGHALDLKIPTPDSLSILYTQTLETQGAESLYTLNSSHSAKIIVSGETRTDALELSRGRLTPQYLPEPVVDVCPYSLNSEQCLLATRNRLWSYDARQDSLRALKVHLSGIRRLAIHPEEGLIYVAIRGQVLCLDWKGTEQWRFECPNYAMPPHLLVLGDGHLVCTSGPMQPFIAVLSSAGELVGRLPVSTPVAGLFEDASGAGFSAVLTGMGGSHPAERLRFQKTQLLERESLRSGVCFARQEAGYVSYIHTDGTARLLGAHGKLLAEHQVEGTLMDVCWNLHHWTWCLLETAGSVTSLRLLQMQPEYASNQQASSTTKNLVLNPLIP